jgi:hypothetical protein
MDKATITMLENLKARTGYSLDEWKNLVTQHGFSKHGDIVKFLKESHNITHGYATTIASKVLGSDSDSVSDKDVLITAQYKGKEHLRPFFDKIVSEVQTFGGDFEISPKKAYVSLRRKNSLLPSILHLKSDLKSVLISKVLLQKAN